MTTSMPKTIGAERRNWFALAVLLVGAFMALLDTTIVNVALPAIRTGLAASNATLSWIVSGYALAFGLALIPAGRVGDRFGHKWVFVVGLSLFTAASLACGLAHGETPLVCARAVQGLGGGIFFTSVTALIQLMFTDRKRARALAITGSTIGFSVALGPLVGGLIIQAFGPDPGWRLVFDVNVPLGVLAVVAAAVLLPVGSDRAATSADWAGLILLSAALVALLVPLIQGQQDGWPLWTYASMAGAAALLAVFARWERHVEASGGNPLVPPRLFAHASFTGGVLLALVYFAAFTSIFFTIALLWQAGLGHTALQSGLVVTPFAVGLVGGASQSDTLAARFGRTVLVAGLGMVAVGITAIWVVLAVTPCTAYSGWQLAAPLLVAGVGSGLFIAPNVDFIVATVDAEDAGAASGVIGTAQRIGSAIGIAIIGTVLFGTLHVDRPGPAALAAAFAHSATQAMAASAGLGVAAFALVFALPRRTWGR
ncbi:MFS transporter [Mycobacterium sp. E2989]|uniref:MFS transporter n=1 Tax=Mycobacterium sp. E2989 TaxID=1834140 RepID=UPI000AB20F12|nr:MFS transporter [Mycobacterium sp. E2989]